MSYVNHRLAYIVVIVSTVLWATNVWGQSRVWFSVAEQGTIDNLGERFAALKRGKMPEGYFGFHTRNVDAMYFAYEEDVFWFEYEIADQEREAFVQPITDLARKLKLETSDGSYGKTPIVKVRLTPEAAESAELVQRIALEIFGITLETSVEFVP